MVSVFGTTAKVEWWTGEDARAEFVHSKCMWCVLVHFLCPHSGQSWCLLFNSCRCLSLLSSSSLSPLLLLFAICLPTASFRLSANVSAFVCLVLSSSSS